MKFRYDFVRKVQISFFFQDSSFQGIKNNYWELFFSWFLIVLYWLLLNPLSVDIISKFWKPGLTVKITLQTPTCSKMYFSLCISKILCITLTHIIHRGFSRQRSLRRRGRYSVSKLFHVCTQTLTELYARGQAEIKLIRTCKNADENIFCWFFFQNII